MNHIMHNFLKVYVDNTWSQSKVLVLAIFKYQRPHCYVTCLSFWRITRGYIISIFTFLFCLQFCGKRTTKFAEMPKLTKILGFFFWEGGIRKCPNEYMSGAWSAVGYWPNSKYKIQLFNFTWHPAHFPIRRRIQCVFPPTDEKSNGSIFNTVNIRDTISILILYVLNTNWTLHFVLTVFTLCVQHTIINVFIIFFFNFLNCISIFLYLQVHFKVCHLHNLTQTQISNIRSSLVTIIWKSKFNFNFQYMFF